LFELAEFPLGEQVVKFRLTAQDDLQQLVAIRLEVRQQSNLFEQVTGQQVRFVNYEHRAKPLRVARHQNVAEHSEHSGFRLLRLQAKLARKQVEEFAGRKQRIEDVSCKDRAIERLKH
jgi:hypothetical protein